ncbi:MAG TPA: 50S ribosomal protein L17 [Candidatus Bathyarchaeia archaeon]|jgi:large subunit ribosomal protein L17|nr:50S ribosomal protein L17 [Candidatus Bathyarchaeia archaeon]
MRHLKAGRKLGRSSSHRSSLYRNLVAELMTHDRIRTTDQKAKEVRRFADRMVTLGKDGTLAARRRALAFIRDRKAVKRLFDDVAKRFADRHGGYTRIVKLGVRHGDAASLSMIELTGTSEEVAPAKKRRSRAKAPERGRAQGGGGARAAAG